MRAPVGDCDDNAFVWLLLYLFVTYCCLRSILVSEDSLYNRSRNGAIEYVFYL